MDWRPYAACCPQAARQNDTTFCPECGRLLLRCMAFAECRTLVTPRDPCTTCFAPSLFIDAGATLTAKAGDSLSIPLVLKNGSPRPVWVTDVVKSGASGYEPVSLPWDGINPNGEQSLVIHTLPLSAGRQALTVIAILASRFKGHDERHAWAGVVKLDVQGEESRQLVQNIRVEGTGGMVYMPGAGQHARAGSTEMLRQREPVGFERATRYEIEHGVRGYRKRSVRASRDVVFSFSGFPAADIPPPGPIQNIRGILSCGRNSRQYDAQINPSPNDLSLRIYDPVTGKRDQDASRAISGYHFDLLIENDRVCVQARSSNGLRLASGSRLAPGEIAPLEDGERIIPVSAYEDELSLVTSFRTSAGAIDEVRIARVPAIARAAD